MLGADEDDDLFGDAEDMVLRRKEVEEQKAKDEILERLERRIKGRLPNFDLI